MRKYWFIFKIELAQLMELRLDFWVKWLTSLLIVIMNYFVWTTAFASGKSFGGYALESIVAYFITTSFLYNIVLIHRQELISRDIVEGGLSTLLVRPLSYPLQIFCRAMVSRIVFTTIGAAMLYVVSLFIVQFPFPSFQNIAIGLFAIIFAVILYTCFDFLMGILAFWLARSNGPRWIFSIIGMLASGIMFPIDLLPSSLERILFATPFPYIIYFPASVLVGHFNSTSLVQGMFAGLFWSIVLAIFTTVVWRRGIRTFDGSGI